MHNYLLSDSTLTTATSGNTNVKNDYDNRRKRFQGDDDRRLRLFLFISYFINV